MDKILTIWLKELRDTLRDRRTLIVMLVVPIVIYPLLFTVIGKIGSLGDDQPSPIAVAGAAGAPSLVAALLADPKLAVTLGGNPRDAVRAKAADAGLIVPRGLEAALRAGGSARLELVENSTRGASTTAVERLRGALDRYSASLVARRLHARGLSPALLSPLTARTADLASKEERGGFFLSFILPLFIVIYAITGGMYTAMDVSAGEKERSTLEALLLTPCTRTQITVGKLLAVATVAFVTIVAALTSMVITLSHTPIPSANGEQINASLDPAIVPLIFALGILMALAFSALELALGILARSFKEAQSYITPLYLGAFLPVVVINTIPGLQPPAALFLVPAVNAVLLFKEALLGQTNALHAAITLLDLAAFAAISVALTVYMFTREKVLLKT